MSAPTASAAARDDRPAPSAAPYPAPHGLLSEIRAFILHRAAIPTRILSESHEERADYGHRIMQRLGVDVTGYSVLNLHRIGIEAPVSHVFEELLHWDAESSCWPNYIGTAARVDGSIEHIRIQPLGRSRISRGIGKIWTVGPLFDLTALRVQRVPGSADVDNARYVLYRASGGYPIGIFVMYVRSPIADLEETEASQFFLGVSFNFYGKEKLPPIFYPVNRAWEALHNRVTANVLNRFKRLCEWRFGRIQDGL